MTTDKQPPSIALPVRHFTDRELIEWLDAARVGHFDSGISTMRDGHSKHAELLEIVRAALNAQQPVSSPAAPVSAEAGLTKVSESEPILMKGVAGYLRHIGKPGMAEIVEDAAAALEPFMDAGGTARLRTQKQSPTPSLTSEEREALESGAHHLELNAKELDSSPRISSNREAMLEDVASKWRAHAAILSRLSTAAKGSE